LKYQKIDKVKEEAKIYFNFTIPLQKAEPRLSNLKLKLKLKYYIIIHYFPIPTFTVFSGFSGS